MKKLQWIVLKLTGFLKPIYRRLGIFPYRGSISLQKHAKTKTWANTGQIKQLGSALYEQRHTSITALLLLIGTLLLTIAADISPFKAASWFSINTVWQTHATIIGLSFVVLIFLLEIVSQSRLVEGALEQFLRKSMVLPILVYSLLGSLIIGVLAIYPDLRTGWISPNLPAMLFAGTVFGVIFAYWKVITLVLTDKIDQEAYIILKENISQKIQQDTTIYEYDQILETYLPDGVKTEKTLYPYYGGRTDSLTAHDLELNGVIADIHLPTFVYGISEIVRIGEKHRKNDAKTDGDETSPDDEEDTPVEVRVKIGDNLQELSSILYIDSDFFHEDMESVYPIIAASILTRPGTGRDDSIQKIHKYTDFIDQEGKRIVRNAESRAFLHFLNQYEDVVQHSFQELDEARFLIEEHRYTNADLPFYNLDQILFRVFEESLDEMNREFTNHILELLEALVHTTTQMELYGAYQRYMNQYSRFYFAVALRDDNLPENFSVGIIDHLIEKFEFSALNGMHRDYNTFDNLDGFEYYITSYSEVALEQAHRMFKYAFENQDARGFTKIWDTVTPQRDTGNDAVQETIRKEKQDLRFNAAAMTYDVSKDHEKYQETFDTIYNRCILKTYHDLPELFDIYFRIKEKEGNRTRWGQWQRQEHDIIQEMHGKPYSIEPVYSLGEFYCFTGILTGYLYDDRDVNPLNGKSLSEEDFRRIRMSVHDVKRKKPFIDVRQYIDEDDYDNLADRFLKYHKEIVDET
ncbi:hypothetical protein [Haloprofundus halophilus]|uniref:hypothetical protein n=1 Tax=Haloprofundus halophilus TaxID=2283527 RepID=UPI000E42EC49|nr:hypothetical protein [Haloprofundus halophilus]